MTELTFTQLKKKARHADVAKPAVKLAVLGTCATQLLATAIRGSIADRGLYPDVFDADYDQIDAQLMDPSSEFYTFDPYAAVIYMCSEKLYPEFCASADKAHFAEQTFAKVRSYWERISAGCSARIFQFTFVETLDGAFGNFGARTPVSFTYQLRKLNMLMMEGCQDFGNVFPIDLNAIQSRMGREIFYDDKFYYLAKMPISTAALPEVAVQVTDVLMACRGSIVKCVICDLDNTLWGGVIGDDGLEGIEIGDLGQGHAFEELQMFLKELKGRGILLGVCSKNEEAAARLPFEQHPDMILRMEDFSIFVANWEDKASNIARIRETLNIGIDSIVFLDDNPFERDQVRSMLPGIIVPELPADPSRYVHTIRALNLFETASWSEADADRTAQYQAQARRAESAAQFADYDEYLQSLEMKAVAAPFAPFFYPRLAQLSQRSNQFNLRTVRLDEAQVQRLAEDEQYLTLYFTLQDKFGDHGLISEVILKKADADTLFIENWLMSCRVLKRGMEEFIINKVMACAAQEHCRRVIGEYIRTPKNNMVSEIYSRLGFTALGKGRFEALVDTFTPNKTYIREDKT